MEEDMLKVLHTTQCMKMIQKVLFSSFYNIDVSIIKIKMFEYWLSPNWKKIIPNCESSNK